MENIKLPCANNYRFNQFHKHRCDYILKKITSLAIEEIKNSYPEGTHVITLEELDYITSGLEESIKYNLDLFVCNSERD